MSDRTIGILGLGIFGSSVLGALAKHDMNIIAIDDHEERINQFEPVLARGVVGDITDEELLLSAGIDTCDTVVVATGENLESSVLAVMHCKSLGVPTVIAKVKSHTAKRCWKKLARTQSSHQSLKWDAHWHRPSSFITAWTSFSWTRMFRLSR